MEKITSVTGLKNAIRLLEDEQAKRGRLLKEQLFMTYESFKPAKLIHSTLKDMVSSPHMIDNIIDTTISLATGYLSKKIVVGTSSNIIRRLIGSLIQVGATKFVRNHTETIRSIGQLAYQKIFRKKKENIDKP